MYKELLWPRGCIAGPARHLTLLHARLNPLVRPAVPAGQPDLGTELALGKIKELLCARISIQACKRPVPASQPRNQMVLLNNSPGRRQALGNALEVWRYVLLAARRTAVASLDENTIIPGMPGTGCCSTHIAGCLVQASP